MENKNYEQEGLNFGPWIFNSQSITYDYWTSVPKKTYISLSD